MKQVAFINCMGGVGKTSALLSLIDNAMDARKRVVISFNYDELLDGKQRLRTILDHLDQDASAGESASVILRGDPNQCVPWVLWDVDSPDGSIAISRAEFRSMVRSALREIARAMHIVLAILEKLAHPVAEFLLEHRWFLLHSSHPPRPFRQRVPICRWMVCSRLASVN
jgi:hypothetical protein